MDGLTPTPRAEALLDTVSRLRTEKAPLEAHCEEIHRYILPSITPPLARSEAMGDKAHAEVLDNTAESANDMLAAAIHDAITPEAIDWFSLRITDDESLNDDPEIGAWLEDCAARMLNVFRSPRAGYALAAHEMRVDLVTFGTGCLAVLDRPGEGIVFVAVPFAQVLLETDADGRVVGVYRDFELTAVQALRAWPDDVGPAIRRAATGRSAAERNRTFRFVHAVTRRLERDPGRAAIDNRHKPWAEEILSVTDRRILRTGGYDENPFITPRWTKRAGEPYGRSQSMKVLGDVKMLQRAARVNIAGAELAMRPPLLVSDDGVLGPVRLTAAGLNKVRGDALMGSGSPIRPLLTGARPDIGEELMAAIRQRIETTYFKPLIQLVRKDRMTATEVLEVMAQNQRILSPFLGRLKAEDVGPTVERMFAIMLRGGAFRPMPAKLSEREIGVEYVSPMVKRQRLAQAQGLAQFLEIVTPLSSLKPEVFDNLDVDRAFRDTADIMGLYKDWVRKAEVVTSIREERQQVQEQAAQRQAFAETAGAAADAARALPALRQTLNSPTEAFDAAA